MVVDWDFRGGGGGGKINVFLLLMGMFVNLNTIFNNVTFLLGAIVRYLELGGEGRISFEKYDTPMSVSWEKYNL